ncbi:Protein of unknown function DUF4498 [Carpediemonas membranifera]|uniref:Cilia- and flagella-associated protein 300 n=1 Tax=Carpediemonas membranifera TaxID=201153 RepID=A0A8J6BC87_9EUKA|nr:Protein of unknown function DUF4498 [Carpediemonas membranifera]|eukprot:KAG9397217.1 Protein of unknown function DUF4498 [Carpediemonas membranifera]
MAGFEFERVEVNRGPFDDEEIKKNLSKWDIEPHSTLAKFSFSGERYDGTNSEELLKALFSSEAFQSIQVTTNRDIRSCPTGTVGSIKFTELSCQALTLDMFERLNGPIIRPDGSIAKCIPDTFEGIPIHNLLQTLLVHEDDPDGNYFLYSDFERSEFLFQLLSTLVVGGGMCQFDDEWEPYEETLKALFKYFVAVFRNSQTKAIESQVKAFNVESIDGIRLFPDERLNRVSRVRFNQCFVCVNAFTHTVTVWVVPFIPVF